MKKLILGAALVLVTALFTACGADKSESATAVSDATVTTRTADKETQDTGTQSSSNFMVEWQTKDVKALDLKPLEINEVTITENVKIKVATTPFDFSVDEIKARLEENQFINDNYVLAMFKGDITEGDTYSDVGNKFKYDITEKICGVYKAEATSENTDYSHMYVAFGRDTSKYDNYSSINIVFNQVKPDSNFQNGVYSIIRDALGEEYAEYMVYAKDADGKNLGQYDLIDEVFVEDYIQTSNGTYLYTRSYSENKDNTFNISFELKVSEDGIKNSFVHHEGGYTSVSESLTYTFDTMVNGEIGNSDYQQLNTLCDEYMQIGFDSYSRTLLDNISTSYLVADNGIKVTEYDLVCLRGSADYGKLFAPELGIDYTVVENADGIHKIEYSIEGSAGHISKSEDRDASYTKLVEVMKQRVNCLFPEVDLSDVTFSAMTDELKYSKKITANVQGVELTGKVTFRVNGSAVDTYTGSYKITLEYSK